MKDYSEQSKNNIISRIDYVYGIMEEQGMLTNLSSSTCKVIYNELCRISITTMDEIDSESHKSYEKLQLGIIQHMNKFKK